MSALRTGTVCCGGRGGAARGLVDRGVFLHEVAVARRSGRQGHCALSSVCTGLVSGYVDLFGRLLVVLCENAGTRL